MAPAEGPRYIPAMRSLAFAAALFLATPVLAANAPPQLAPYAVKQLDKLMPKLAKAGSPEAAKPIETQVLTLFNQSGSPSIDLLMVRAAAAAQSGDMATSSKILESITDIAPGFAEAWRVRGMMAADVDNDKEAIIYLNRAITLNPRQFQAYADLAGILAEYGDKKQALQYFRKALALDPYYDGLDKRVQQLARQVEGEKI
jgi:tetratricopeptide (TPR) repeat protein